MSPSRLRRIRDAPRNVCAESEMRRERLRRERLRRIRAWSRFEPGPASSLETASSMELDWLEIARVNHRATWITERRESLTVQLFGGPRRIGARRIGSERNRIPPFGAHRFWLNSIATYTERALIPLRLDSFSTYSITPYTETDLHSLRLIQIRLTLSTTWKLNYF